MQRLNWYDLSLKNEQVLQVLLGRNNAFRSKWLIPVKPRRPELGRRGTRPRKSLYSSLTQLNIPPQHSYIMSSTCQWLASSHCSRTNRIHQIKIKPHSKLFHAKKNKLYLRLQEEVGGVDWFVRPHN